MFDIDTCIFFFSKEIYQYQIIQTYFVKLDLFQIDLEKKFCINIEIWCRVEN